VKVSELGILEFFSSKLKGLSLEFFRGNNYEKHVSSTGVMDIYIKWNSPIRKTATSFSRIGR
jgi:hypothetical protein